MDNYKRHEGPSSPNMERGIEMERTDKSDTAWIEEMMFNIRHSFLSFMQVPESKTPSIFMVPHGLRGQSPQHYQPKVVSIGPYHRNNSNLLMMQNERKWLCVEIIMTKYSIDLQQWISDMRLSETDARNYYSEDVSEEVSMMDSKLFLEMLLVDGCFILYVLLYFERIAASLPLDQIMLGLPLDQIMLDLLLLENQIPFFVLVKLANGSCEEIIKWALNLFGSLGVSGNPGLPIRPKTRQVRHLLHLFHLSLCPAVVESVESVESAAPAVSKSSQIRRHVPSATELQDRYAVKFKKRIADNFLDIRFLNGVMEIPVMNIHDNIGTVLRNLIAFEQCYRPIIEPRVATYAAFMDCLINKESDANLLEMSGVLLNRLPTSRDAAFFFSKLTPGAEFRNLPTFLDHVFVDVYKYQIKRRNRWYADLKLNYFSNPWVILSVVAAAVLLILGFIQSCYSVLSYYHM